MGKADLDQLRLAYKKAVDEWVDAIRAEEALATPDHSMIAMEAWDAVGRTWVQSWVQQEGRFQPKTGVKLRQINESVDGS